jgi:hypothetical protein
VGCINSGTVRLGYVVRVNYVWFVLCRLPISKGPSPMLVLKVSLLHIRRRQRECVCACVRACKFVFSLVLWDLGCMSVIPLAPKTIPLFVRMSVLPGTVEPVFWFRTARTRPVAAKSVSL